MMIIPASQTKIRKSDVSVPDAVTIQTMQPPVMSGIDTSHFAVSLMQHNRLDRLGFQHWIFHAGMGFRDGVTWWAGRDSRPVPHEGVDFCCFENHAGQLIFLTEDILVPVMYDGEVIKVFDDFLGKSILIGHEHQALGTRLHSVYGHTRPVAHMQTGSQVTAGEVIALLAGSNKKTITPHLHLTVLWALPTLNQKKINWHTLTDPAVAILCDPLAYLKHP